MSPVLSRWGRWYVFGAQAVIAYGVPRLSADVDVTVGLDPDDPERFAREMAAAGFALRVDDPDFDLLPHFESLVRHGAPSRQAPREDSGR